MKILNILLFFCFSSINFSLSAAIPIWYIEYEQTVTESPKNALDKLSHLYKAMPPSTERIYLSLTAQKLANKFTLPFKLQVNSQKPLVIIEKTLSNAIHAASSGNYKESIQLFELAQNLVVEETHPELYQLILENKLWTQISAGNYNESARRMARLNQYASKITESKIDPKSRLNLAALIASHHGDYKQALTYFQMILDTKPNTSTQAATHNNIALTLIDIGQYKDAISHLKNALKLSQLSKETYKIALAQLNLGIAYSKKMNYPQAKIHLRAAKARFDTLNHTLGTGNTNVQLAKYQLAINQPHQALILLSETLNMPNITQYTALLIDVNLTLTKTHIILSQYDWALQSANASLALIQRNNDITHELKALHLLVKIHAHLAQFERAYTYQNQLLQLQKRQFQKQSEKRLTSIQAQLQKSKSALTEARLEQANLAQQHKIQQLQYNQYRLCITILFVGIIALLFWRSRNRQRYLAEHDALTGVLNRAALLNKLVKYPAPKNAHFAHAVVLFDLDDFKKVNDTYGHPAGDQTLVHCCDVMRQTLSRPHLLARIGGEEFVLFIPNMKKASVPKLLESIRLALSHSTISLSCKNQLSITASFAYYLSESEQHTHFSSVYSALDAGLYQAKAQGKNCITAVSTL